MISSVLASQTLEQIIYEVSLHCLLDTLFFSCFLNWLVGFVLITDLKKLQSLEICGGGLTDAGVKNIKDLSSLTLLNLSQNSNLTDKTLELISGKYSKLAVS